MATGFRFPPNIFSATESAVLEQSGLTVDTVAARSAMIVNSNFTDIWPLGGTRAWLETAEPLVAISTNANDTVAGSGAQEVVITGLNALGSSVTETLALNGTSLTSPTATSFLRLNDAQVSKVGIYGGVNGGDITIQTSSSAIIQGFIETEVCRQEQSHVTVPATAFALAYGLSVCVEANKDSTVRILVRLNAYQLVSDFSPILQLFEFPGLLGFINFSNELPFRFPPLTDIWLVGRGSNPNTIISLSYGLLLVG
jgi:hypothetical protein